MATEFGKLVLTITTDPAQMIAGLDRAAARAQQFSGAISRTLQNAFSVATGNVLTRAASGVTGFVGGVARSVRETTELASRTGSAADAITTLVRASSNAGQRVDDWGGILGSFSQRLVEAQTGNQALSQTFRELGLDAGRLSRAGAAEAVRETLEALGRVGDAGARSAAGFRLFGDEYARLSRLAEQGGFGRAAEEVRQMGLSLEGDRGEGLREAVAAVDRIQDAFRGAALELAVRIAPHVQSIADGLVEWVSLLGQSVDLAAQVGRSMADAAASTWRFLGFGRDVHSFRPAEGGDAGPDRFEGGGGSWDEPMARAAGAADALTQAMRGLRSAAEETAVSLRTPAESFAAEVNRLRGLTGFRGGLTAEQVSRGIGRAGQALLQGGPGAVPNLAGAALQGSAEAGSVIARNNARVDSVQERMRQVLELQLRQEEIQAGVGRQILEELRRMGRQDIPVFEVP